MTAKTNAVDVLTFLSGKKSYVVGAAMIIVGLYQSDTELVMEGIGLMTLRAGVTKSGVLNEKDA